jgi:hypothetical protein
MNVHVVVFVVRGFEHLEQTAVILIVHRDSKTKNHTQTGEHSDTMINPTAGTGYTLFDPAVSVRSVLSAPPDPAAALRSARMSRRSYCRSDFRAD